MMPYIFYSTELISELTEGCKPITGPMKLGELHTAVTQLSDAHDVFAQSCSLATSGKGMTG